MNIYGVIFDLTLKIMWLGKNQSWGLKTLFWPVYTRNKYMEYFFYFPRIHGCKPASRVPQNYLFHLKRCFTNYFPIYQAHKLQKQMQLPIASKLEKRSNSVPTNRNDTSHSNAKDEDEDEDDQPRNNKIMAEAASSSSSGDVNTARPSISNENNILLDPDVLDDQVTES